MKIPKAGYIYPIELTVADSENSYRFGGNPPVGVTPTRPGLHYLMTIEVDAMTECSIFVSWDTNKIIPASDVLHPPVSEVVEVVIHANAPRCKNSQYESPLSSHGIKLLAPEADREDVDVPGLGPSSLNKIGGEPFEGQMAEEIQGLKDAGYVHVLQIEPMTVGLPDFRIPHGSSPFGSYIFHLYLAPREATYDWICFWTHP